MTPNDFLKVIQDSLNKRYEPVPDGWYCTDDLMSAWNTGRSSVQERIKEGKKLGCVTERKFFVKKNGGRMIPYYKFHEKEDNQKENKRKNLENTIRSRRKN
jgi:predicted transcriptional regulator